MFHAKTTVYVIKLYILTRHAKFPSELRATVSHCIMGLLNANSSVWFLHDVYIGFLILMLLQESE